MARWLVKQEPTSYSYAELERERRTRWDGVHNALALRHLRGMRPGDEAFFYHSGSERACVGVLRVASLPRADANDPRGSWWVEVTPVRRLERPVTLSEIRADAAFRGFDLLRMSRLSVLPVPDSMWARILTLANEPGRGVPTGAPRGRARAAVRPPKRVSAKRTR